MVDDNFNEPLTAGLWLARNWFEGKNLEVFVISGEEQPALRVPLMVKGRGYALFMTEFADDQVPELKLLSFNVELVRGAGDDGAFFRHLISLLQGALNVGHLATDANGESVDFHVEHMHCGEIPDCVFDAVYKEVVKVLGEIAPAFNASRESEHEK